MTYQEVVDFIRTVANTVNPTGHFMHGRRTDGSLDFNEAFPQIHLLPIRSNIDRSSGFATHIIVLGFWQQDTPQTSNEEREAIIAEMWELCNDFMDYIDTNYNYRIENEAMTPEYRQLAGTASGYGLTFTLTSKLGCLNGES